MTAIPARRFGAIGTFGVLSLLLAGCATPPPKAPPYVPPASGPTARALVRASVSAGDIYAIAVHADALNCQTPRIATTGGTQLQPTPVTLAAGQLATVDFLFVRANKQNCIVRTSLMPAAGKTYLFAGTLMPVGCYLRVLDATQPDAIKPEPSAVRRAVPNNRCVPMAEAKPINVTATSAATARDDAVLSPGATSDDLSGLLGR